MSARSLFLKKLLLLLTLLCLLIVLLFFGEIGEAGDELVGGSELQEYIKIDQFGYRPGDSKVAVLVNPQQGFNSEDEYIPGQVIEVRELKTDEVVFSGFPIEWRMGQTDRQAGDKGWWFDFSEVEHPGAYYIYDVDNNYRSYSFEIAEDVYREVLNTALKMYYYQRLATPIESEFAGEEFADDAAFVGPRQDIEARSIQEMDNPDTALDLSGGWQDAGDYNKYTTFTRSPINELLTTYRLFPEVFSDGDLNIPESGNGVPDILDEVKWKLDWLKKMQYSYDETDGDGGVLLKIGETWECDGGERKLPRSKVTTYRYYIPEKASSATIVVALNFAHAAYVFQEFSYYEDYVAELEERAVAAWEWFMENPMRDDYDDQTIRAGDADMSIEDQEKAAVAAAVYLFALTGEEEYHNYFRENYDKTRRNYPYSTSFWSMYDGPTGDALMFYTTLQNLDEEIKEDILQKRRNNTRYQRFLPSQSLYRAYMPDDQYHWGSLSVKARLGTAALDFIIYDHLELDDVEPHDLKAQNIVHYFHGVNPFGWVYLTQMEEYGAGNSISRIYHYWFKDGTEWEVPPSGYIPGGPNKNYTGDSEPPLNQPIQKAYRDWGESMWTNWHKDKSWEITEPAIYYQSAYIRLLAYFLSKQHE